MTSLVKKIYRSGLSIHVRNIIGFRPSYFDFSKLEKNTSISDGFPWRTDGSFKTIFRFNDLFKLFYKVDNSYLDLHFYNNEFNLIKSITLNSIKLTNELLIDKKFLNNYEGYGSFFAFHKHKNFNAKNFTVLHNKCYLGFSFNNNLPSFVHGNIYVLSENFANKTRTSNFINTSFFCNRKWRIQNNFDDFEKTEIVIVNPTTNKIKLIIKDKIYFLAGLCTKLINIDKTSEVLIRSNCYFLRPAVFNYKKGYLDVYHS